METLLSEKDEVLLVVEGFKFSAQKILNNNVQWWACTKKTCRTYIKTNAVKEVLEKFLEHDHEKENDQIFNRKKISNCLKRKAIEDPSERPLKILQIELKKGDVNTLTADDLNLIRKNLNYARRSVFYIPKTINDLHDCSEKIDVNTNPNKNFPLVNNKSDNMVLFSTISNLMFPCSLSTIFVDGTFYTCSKQFTQVFILHGHFQNLYIPLAFFLSKDKKTESSTIALRYLVSECQKLKLTFSPKIFYVDFEKAIHKAIGTVFPFSTIKGLTFPFRSKLVEQNSGISINF